MESILYGWFINRQAGSYVDKNGINRDFYNINVVTIDGDIQKLSVPSELRNDFEDAIEALDLELLAPVVVRCSLRGNKNLWLVATSIERREVDA